MNSTPFPSSHQEDPLPRKPSFVARMAEMRFFSISFFIHLVLVIILGGAVIFQRVTETEDFVGSISGGDSTSLLPPEQAQEQPSDPTAVPETAPIAPTSLDTITTISAATFAVNATPVTALKIGDVSKSVALSGQGFGTGSDGALGRVGKSGFFGRKDKVVNSLVGTLYDLKQTKSRKETGMNPDKYREVYRKFLKEGWRESVLDEYFKAPQPIYSTQIMIPNMAADGGPKAFGMEKDVKPSLWLIHYQGRVSPPEDGVYHFVGGGDDVMVVRINGKVVLDRCWQQQEANWEPVANYKYGWTGIPNGFAKGDALTLKAGQFYDIEVLIGEQPGVFFYACLLMEKEGVEYKKDAKGNPILPVFRLAQMVMPDLEKDQTFPPYESGGPVWEAQPGFNK